MAPRSEPHDLDRLLGDLPISAAPDGLWERVQEELARPEPAKPVPARRLLVEGRPVLSRMLAAAAIVLALMAGSLIGMLRTYQAPPQWAVSTVSGAPTVDGAALAGTGTLGTGEWLATDSASTARLDVGDIGTAHIGPNSRVRLDPGRRREHRLTLAEGSMDAFIDAPPRLFFVETPTAVATDLGCAYTMEVDDRGVTRIRVTSGWVELKHGDRVSLVAAGLVAEVGIDGVPGTPYPYGMADEAREALGRLERGSNDPADLETVVAAMFPHSMAIPRRQPTTITLWHLLQRLDGELRVRALEALTEISPPPPGVTREGILALDRPMLERWRKDLYPMWSEEDVPLVVRAARRLWEWTVR